MRTSMITLMLLGAAGCATANLDVMKSPTARVYQAVLVEVRSDNLNAVQRAEREFVERAAGLAARFIPAHTVFFPGKTYTEDQTAYELDKARNRLDPRADHCIGGQHHDRVQPEHLGRHERREQAVGHDAGQLVRPDAGRGGMDRNGIERGGPVRGDGEPDQRIGRRGDREAAHERRGSVANTS